nr:putative nuclease HARBI1 [Ipomoea batatas]
MEIVLLNPSARGQGRFGTWELLAAELENTDVEAACEEDKDRVNHENYRTCRWCLPNVNTVIPKIPNSTSEEAYAAGSSGGAPSQGQSQRRLWVKDRSNAWWEQCNSPDFPEEEFKKAFRMSKATFDLIYEELESVVTKKDTTLRLAIPVRQQFASRSPSAFGASPPESRSGKFPSVSA